MFSVNNETDIWQKEKKKKPDLAVVLKRPKNAIFATREKKKKRKPKAMAMNFGCTLESPGALRTHCSRAQRWL